MRSNSRLGNLLARLLGHGRRVAGTARWGTDTRPCCPTCNHRLLRFSPHWLCPNCRDRKATVRVRDGMVEA